MMGLFTCKSSPSKWQNGIRELVLQLSISNFKQEKGTLVLLE